MVEVKGLKGAVWQLVEYFSDLRKGVERNNLYKIVEVSKEKGDKIFFKIKIFGQTNLITLCPQDIVAYDGFLEGFSREDVRLITYLATKELTSPSYELVGHEWKDDKEDGQPFLVFKDKHKKQVFKKNLAQASGDENFLKKIDQKDAYTIGYMRSSSLSEEEATIIKKVRDEK